MHDPHNITWECQRCSTPDIEIDHGSVMRVCTLIFSIKFGCWTWLSIFHLYQFAFFSDMFCILMHLRLRFLFLILNILFRLDKLAIY